MAGLTDPQEIQRKLEEFQFKENYVLIIDGKTILIHARKRA